MIRAATPRSRPASAMPKVGYLLRMYPRFSQTFVVNEILELERQGLDISILSLRRPTDGLFHDSVAKVRARAHYVPEAGREQIRRTLALQWRQLRRSPSAYLRAVRLVMANVCVNWIDLLQAGHVLKWIAKQRIEHLHVHFGTNEATVALLVRMLGGPPYSMTLHAFDIFRQNVDHHVLAAKINASAFTVTVSEYNRQFLIETLAGVKPDRIRVNYNGIDLVRFADSGGPRDELSVFSVGRLIEKKGFRHLIDAVGRLRKEGIRVRCIIAGEGPEEARLRDLIEQSCLEDAVHLAGHMKQEQVREHLRRAACFVLPCIRAADGNVDALPTVLLESLACGCPSVSTRISGIPEIIEDQVSGLLVEAGDAAGLAGAIRSILNDSQLGASLSQRGRRRAEQCFDICKNVKTMREWLCEVAESGQVNLSARAEVDDMTKVTAA